MPSILKQTNNNKKYLNLRSKFEYFEYQSYNFYLFERKILVEFKFNISSEYSFTPKLEIPLSENVNEKEIILSELDTIVFNLGMIELISYWKTICSSKIIIRPKKLNGEQVNWWKKLYFNGLGEFFYLNGITADEDNFVEILSYGDELTLSEIGLDNNKVLLPIGGGKDSVVSLEILKNSDFIVKPMMINPGVASIRTIENAGFALSDAYVVKRLLDMRLLKMNAEGFLNGHTPFSAMLAFTNVLLAMVNGISNIALSNENSANESTVPGTNINHQYSKSFEFEQDFNFYVKKYIHPQINYFSFLRPLNELKIAALFSGFITHFMSFRSCNVGSKKDEWCGNCPKCLFTYIILSPFVEQNVLTKIFSKNLLNDLSLKPILMELTGVSDVKPFECVGTVSEVNAALARFKNSSFYSETNSSLLQLKEFSFLSNNNDFDEILAQFNDENNLPLEFLKILKSRIND